MKGNDNKEIYVNLLGTLEEEKKVLLQIREKQELELQNTDQKLQSLDNNIKETRAKIDSPLLFKFRNITNKIKNTISEKTEQIEQVISNKTEKTFTEELKELGSNLNDRFNQATDVVKTKLPSISNALKEKALTFKDTFIENVNSYKKEILKSNPNPNQEPEPWKFPTSSNNDDTSKENDFSKFSKKEMLELWVKNAGLTIDNKSKQDLDFLYEMYSSFVSVVNEEQRYKKNYFYQGLSNIEALSGITKKLDNKTKKYFINISFLD